ncbi:MAG: hypothetical protein HY689_03155 [Chloroflexi bacterium]|nr:hypothetical protein [Chloroflexota bacterium]
MTTNSGAARCQHHWLITPSEAPTALGTCRKCGAYRLFQDRVAHEPPHARPGRQQEAHLLSLDALLELELREEDFTRHTRAA